MILWNQLIFTCHKRNDFSICLWFRGVELSGENVLFSRKMCKKNLILPKWDCPFIVVLLLKLVFSRKMKWQLRWVCPKVSVSFHSSYTIELIYLHNKTKKAFLKRYIIQFPVLFSEYYYNSLIIQVQYFHVLKITFTQVALTAGKFWVGNLNFVEKF